MASGQQHARTRLIGVEEELLLVDTATGRPRALIEPVLAASQRLTGPIPTVAEGAAPVTHLEREAKQEQVEVVSSPHATLAGVARSLRSGRSLAQQAATELGAHVVALGTSPFDAESLLTHGPRYAAIEHQFRLTMHEQLTCGFHVHVSVANHAEGVAVLDRIRPWLHIVLALSSNSPIWRSSDSGFHSYRTQVWSRWPSAGPTELMGTAEQYDEFVEHLVNTGVLLDRGMIYFDARLSEHYPTVEIRVADACTEIEHAVALAGIARALVSTAAHEWRLGKAPDPAPTQLLRLAAWSASRFGVSSELLSPSTWRPMPARSVVDHLLEHTCAALSAAEDLHRIEQAIDDIFLHGTGATRQLRLLHETGDIAVVVADAAARTASES